MCKTNNRKSNFNADSLQWSKENVCFASASQMWLTVNLKIIINSGKWIHSLKCIACASEYGSSQS